MYVCFINQLISQSREWSCTFRAVNLEIKTSRQIKFDVMKEETVVCIRHFVFYETLPRALGLTIFRTPLVETELKHEDDVLNPFQANKTPEVDQPAAAKKQKLDEGGVRKSQRHRKQRGEKEMKVSSDLTLKAFKIKVQNMYTHQHVLEIMDFGLVYV